MLRLGVLMMQNMESTHFAYIDTTVKQWIERASITIVPIPPNITPTEAAAYFEYVHGLFLHPGWVNYPEYTDLVTLFLNMAIAANSSGEYFPVWGTCQGFQRLVQFFDGRLDTLNSLKFSKGTRIILKEPRTKSRILSYASEDQYNHLKHQFVPWFNHEYGISLKNFRKSRSLQKAFKLLSTSHDKSGVEYVSMVEGIGFPFYGVQFHPEKAHGDLVWMAGFMASELRKSTHTGFHPNPQLKFRDGTCDEQGVVLHCLRLDF
jgi:gamma-glutamyl hydrolase